MADDPVPRLYQDPTALTTAQLQRELTSLEKLFDERLHSLMERVDAMEKAQTLFHDDLVRVPTAVDKAVGQLKELHEKWFLEKFATVQALFVERDLRIEQTKIDGKLAGDAALEAAKEAVGKSESATIKQMEQHASLLQNTRDALNDKIDDIKERLTMLEGRGSGFQASWAIVIAVITVAGIIGMFVLTLRH